MLMGAGVRRRNPRITGSTRSNSSSADTAAAPGRVDSPPTSTTSAPWRTISTPLATAASTSGWRPPSENESGVTLSIPITAVRPRISTSP